MKWPHHLVFTIRTVIKVSTEPGFQRHRHTSRAYHVPSVVKVHLSQAQQESGNFSSYWHHLWLPMLSLYLLATVPPLLIPLSPPPLQSKLHGNACTERWIRGISSCWRYLKFPWRPEQREVSSSRKSHPSPSDKFSLHNHNSSPHPRYKLASL